MDQISSPSLPPTSDPALYEDWEPIEENPILIPSSTNSDDLEALHLVHAESTARRIKREKLFNTELGKLERLFAVTQTILMVRLWATLIYL